MHEFSYHDSYVSDQPDWSRCATEIPPDCMAQMAALRARFRSEQQAVSKAVQRDKRERAFMSLFCEKAHLAFPEERYPDILAFAQWWVEQHGWDAVTPDKVDDHWREFWAGRNQ
jgi:hypothetical protein